MTLRRAADALLAVTLLAPASAARAQLGNPLFNCLSAPVSVTQARYLGKQGTQDTVEVTWTTPGGGVGGIQSGIQASPLICAAQAGLSGSFDVNLTVTRRLGHQDSGTVHFNGRLGDILERNVQVPRGAIETDPQSWQAEVRGPVFGFFGMTARASGSGAPSINGATLAGTTTAQLSGQCSPSFAVTALSLAPSGTGDAVNVSWNLTPPPCMRVNLINVQVKLVNAAGKLIARTASAAPTATSAQVALGEPAGQVASYEVTVSAQLSSVLNLQGSGSGNL